MLDAQGDDTERLAGPGARVLEHELHNATTSPSVVSMVSTPGCTTACPSTGSKVTAELRDVPGKVVRRPSYIDSLAKAMSRSSRLR